MLLVHGYPASSHMWRPRAGRARRARPVRGRARPARLRRLRARTRRETLDAATSRRSRRCAQAEGLERVALVGPRLGRADRPALGVRPSGRGLGGRRVSDTGFFPDGRWHGMADALRTPGQGEELVDGMTLEAFTGDARLDLARDRSGATPREYFKAFADEPRRRGQLELYRSGEFSEARGLRRPAGRARRAVPGAVGRGRPVRAGRRRAALRARDPGRAACRSSPARGTSSTRTRPRRPPQALAALPRRVGAALMHVRELGEGPPVLLLHPGPGPRRHGLPARRRAARREPPRAARRPAGQRPLARRATATSGRWPATRAPSSGSRRTSSCATGRCSGTRSAASSRCSTSSTSPAARRGSSPPAPTRARRRRPGAPEDPLAGLDRRAARAGRGGRGARAGRELAAAAQGRVAASRRRG